MNWFAGICCLAALSVTFLGAQASPHLLLSAFQSGRVVVFQLGAAKPMFAVQAQDQSGVVGVVTRNSDKEIVLVDGDGENRLRMLDAASGRVLLQRKAPSRAPLLGGPPVMRISAGGRWLFLKALDRRTGARSMRVFDFKNRAFLPGAVKGLACGWPEMIGFQDGGIAAVCPGVIQEGRGPRSAGESFTMGHRIPIPAKEISAVTAAPDDAIYVAPSREMDGPLRLIEWRRGSDVILVRSIAEDQPLPAPTSGRQVSVAVSPDGAMFAIGGDTWSIVVERRGLKTVRYFAYSDPIQEIAFGPLGEQVLALDAMGHGVVTASILTGDVRLEPLPDSPGQATSRILRVLQSR